MLVKDLIKQIRYKCDITQETLSDWSGINQSSLCQYEKGNRTPRIAALKKLLDVANKKANLNVTFMDIDF